MLLVDTSTPAVGQTMDIPACKYGDSRLPQRFWDKVEVQPDGCWTWTASRDLYGYGYFGRAGKNSKAHRVMVEAMTGDWPGEKHVLHRCDNPPCCNPRHLLLGDHHANMRDRAAKGRGPGQGATHCKRGHEWTAENTSSHTAQGRKCKRCNADRMIGKPRHASRGAGARPERIAS